ncbi:MAG: MFS transporter [Alphaproteobacteria bacterium]|nr:MFS transporter [Alphaproteobacteria bacterium]
MVRMFMLRYAPIMSLAIMMMAMGLFNTLVPLRLEALQYSELAIGFVGSIYYLGMFIGSISVIKFLDKVGPSKTFIFSTLALSFVAIIPGLNESLIIWIVTRFIGGYSLAWVYVVVESWVLRVSTKNNRGRNLAVYMIVLYLGQSVGQLFLGFTGIVTILPLAVASILCFTSIGPIISVKNVMPNIKIPDALGFFNLYKISPTGILGCVLSGLLLGSIYSLLPLYFKETGYDVATVATLMSLTIAGGVVMQYPFGLLADCMDRRMILIILCIGV